MHTTPPPLPPAAGRAASLAHVTKRLAPGQNGTKRWQREFGETLVCVRYRLDSAQRYTTVELVVDTHEAKAMPVLSSTTITTPPQPAPPVLDQPPTPPIVLLPPVPPPPPPAPPPPPSPRTEPCRPRWVQIDAQDPRAKNSFEIEAAGGRWDIFTHAWWLPEDAARSLGLKPRQKANAAAVDPFWWTQKSPTTRRL